MKKEEVRSKKSRIPQNSGFFDYAPHKRTTLKTAILQAKTKFFLHLYCTIKIHKIQLKFKEILPLKKNNPNRFLGSGYNQNKLCGLIFLKLFNFCNSQAGIFCDKL